MSDIPETIRQKILGGNVLDDNGAWVPINVMLAKERDFMRHLENGEVIVNDRWVTIEEAKNASSPAR
jgi:hypothetical protein